MQRHKTKRPIAAALVAFSVLVGAADAGRGGGATDDQQTPAQLGTRPFYLVDQMQDGPLKAKLESCADGPFSMSDFSIGHRGAALQFPEHTQESYEAAARMGAGILECDVTFTKDAELVCRHAQCDLHTTTDVVVRPELRDKCSTPPKFDADGTLTNASEIQCCASDFTLEEFKSLCCKMDASNPNATTVEEFLGGTANWRTELYSTCGTLLSHRESIALFERLGRKMTPELKGGDEADIAAVFGGQEAYAQAMIDDYKDAGVDPGKVYAQSFNLDDVTYWIANEPQFGQQAIYLISEDPNDPLAGAVAEINNKPPPFEDFRAVRDQGVHIIAPPMPVLLTDVSGEIQPSAYAKRAREVGFDLISWTTERSGRIVEDVLKGDNTFYYQTTLDALNNDGDILTTIDVLARQVGIMGLFSDWPATTTYYANCLLDGD